MNKVEKIRAEIERLKGVNDIYKTLMPKEAGITLRAYDKVLSFIDSISEEPVSDDLEGAWNVAYDEEKDDILCVYDHHAGFVGGCKWKEEQLMKNAIECKVGWYDGYLLEYTQEQQDDVLEQLGVNIGDKVKVIIVKE